MAQPIAILLAIVIGGGLTVFMVHPGIDLLRRLIGKDRCFGSEALNGCSTWGYGALCCAVLVAISWRRFGFVSLAFVPAVPIAAVLFWTGYYLLLGLRSRRREFVVRDENIFRGKDYTPIVPEYAAIVGDYSQTGPASGYGVSGVQLGRDGVTLATNVYIDASLAERQLQAVLGIASLRCRALDLIVLVKSDELEWQIAGFGGDWTPLLCGRLADLSPDDTTWWRQWLQPTFGAMGRSVIPADELTGRLDRIVEAYPQLFQKNPADPPNHDQTSSLNLLMGTVRMRDNLRAMRALAERHSFIELTTTAAHDAVVEQLRKGTIVSHSFDSDGVEIEVIGEA